MGKVSHKLISKLNVFSRKRQQFQHVPVPEDEEEDIEDFRTRGCEILKAISDETHKATISTITTRSKSKSKRKNDGDYNNNNNNHHTSSTDCDVHGIEIEFEMDWNETIQRFQEQQQQLEQQQHQQQQQMMLEIKSQGGNEDAHKRKNKVQRLKLLKRALERRRKFDNKGSFAINMVTYRDETNPCGSAEPGALPAAADAAAAAYADDRARARARVGNKTEHDSHSSNSRYEHLGCDDRSCRSSIMTTISNDFTLKSIDEESEYCDNGNYDDNSTSSSNININNINGNNTQSIILGIMSLGY